jgi:anti-sigma factor RsiW
MNCTQVTDRLNAYFDGELPEEVAERVERHLEGCADCAAELEHIRELNSSLDLVSQYSGGEDFAERVRKTAEEQKRSATIIPFRLFTAARVRVAAAAAILVVAGFTLGALMSRTVAETRTADAGRTAASYEEYEPSVDSLSALPSTSMAAAYLEISSDGSE